MGFKLNVNELITVKSQIPVVSTILSFKDYVGMIRVRLGISRDSYKVEPGIYAAGNPDSKSDVFVTANYKLSFDHLRKNLESLSAWILVLDTKGINVWCAAGKGTFGTKELVNRIKTVELETIVSHKKLIVPQLGATGISAHAVQKESGFKVVYGPVRAADIKAYIENGYKATSEMRRVRFNFADRMILVPVDMLYAKKLVLLILLLFLILSGINRNGISFHQILNQPFKVILAVLSGYISGIVITPALLPYIPGRSFAFKGFVTGIISSSILWFYNVIGYNLFEVVSWVFVISSLSSFLAMNFTGSSTYTSLSGVKKEIKIAMPVQITMAVVGLLLYVTGKII